MAGRDAEHEPGQQNADIVRRHIDRGLARYGAGSLDEAAAEWGRALALDPENAEARRLLAFVRARSAMPESGEVAGSPRSTERVVATVDPVAWSVDHGTDPESARDLTQRLMRAEREAAQSGASMDGRRPTVESPISSLLARATAPNPAPSRGDAPSGAPAPPSRAPVPLAPHSADETPRLGRELAPRRSGHAIPAGAAPPAPTGRVPDLMADCRAALDAGRLEDAVALAEEALRLADASPGSADLDVAARSLCERAFEAFLKPKDSVPVVALAPDRLAAEYDIDHRAGFLLSRADGVMSFEHLLDVAGMPRFDALRILATLVRRKALKLL